MKTKPALIDHIGWDLHRATGAWKDRFVRDMVKGGFAWFGEARGTLVQHVGRDGILQTDLTRKSGMSKQAVQQHLDDLVRDEVLERVPDQSDARRKIIRFTEKGFAALTVANTVKEEIDRDYAKLVGAADMDALRRALDLIGNSNSGEGSP